jgi:hypothetical protein
MTGDHDTVIAPSPPAAVTFCGTAGASWWWRAATWFVEADDGDADADAAPLAAVGNTDSAIAAVTRRGRHRFISAPSVP